MALLVLFITVFVAGIQGRISRNDENINLCVVAETVESEKNFASGLLDIYEFVGYKYQYWHIPDKGDIIPKIKECSCLYDKTSTIFVYASNSTNELATFLGNDNACKQIPENTRWKPEYDQDGEYFIYAEKFKICYIDENLLGHGCNTANEADWTLIEVGGDYSITDIPEVTKNGFMLFTETGKKSYLCRRISSEQVKPIYFFESVDACSPDDQIATAKFLSWKKVSTVLQFIYKILDIFYGDGK
nr:VP7 [Bat RVJ-like rotavirus BtSY3]